jgi:WD40 repeat protein
LFRGFYPPHGFPPDCAVQEPGKSDFIHGRLFGFRPVVRQRLLSLVVLVLTACVGQPVAVAPDVVHTRVHNGGSTVGFSQSGDLLASGGWEGTVLIWQLPGGEPVYRWQAHQDSVNGLVFTDNDRHVVTAGYDGWLAKWTLGGVALHRVKTPGPIRCLAASNHIDRLITGHDDGSVRIWRLHDLRLLEERKLHRGNVKAVAIETSGRRYASGGADGDVYVWTDDTEAVPLERPPTDAWTLTFSPDGQWLYGGGWFRLFRWRLSDGAFASLPTEHHGIIKSIQFTPDGDELATISRQTDSAVLFLDPVTGAVTRRFQQHELCGASISVSPRGRYLATTSDDASVRIWVLSRQGEKWAY